VLEREAKAQVVAPTGVRTVVQWISPITEMIGPDHQIDVVYRLPNGDWGAEDPLGSIVARIRTQSNEFSTQAFVTVKRRRTTNDLDREEVEIAIQDGDQGRALLELLGLELVITVTKDRWTGTLGDGLSVLVDEIEGLGTFVEVEVLSDEARDPAEVLRDLGEKAGLTLRSVDTTYDRMLLRGYS
jgi:adenylate cyclase class 2